MEERRWRLRGAGLISNPFCSSPTRRNLRMTSDFETCSRPAISVIALPTSGVIWTLTVCTAEHLISALSECKRDFAFLIKCGQAPNQA